MEFHYAISMHAKERYAEKILKQKHNFTQECVEKCEELIMDGVRRAEPITLPPHVEVHAILNNDFRPVRRLYDAKESVLYVVGDPDGDDPREVIVTCFPYDISRSVPKPRKTRRRRRSNKR